MQAVSRGFYVGLAVAVCTVYGVMLVPAVWRNTEAAKPTLEIIAPYDGPVRFYVGPWVWSGYWHAPDGTVGLVDLRSLSDASTAEEARGYGFFAVHGELAPPYVDLGTDLDAEIDPALWPVCSVPPGIYTVEELLWNTLTVWADPETHNGPLLPDSRGNLELWLNVEPPALARGMELSTMARSATVEPALPEPLVQRAWQGASDPSWPVVQETLHQAYRETPEDVRGKLLTDWQRVYRIEDVREFIPPDMAVIEPEPMETSYSEDFEKADSDTLGPDLTWDEYLGDIDVVSGLASCMTTGSLVSARATNALSSSNNWSELSGIGCAGIFGAYGTIHAAARFTTALGQPVYYSARIWAAELAPDPEKWAIFQVSGATETMLSASETEFEFASSDTLRCTVDGSSISIAINGVTLATVTNSSIAAGTNCGFGMFESGAGAGVSLDDFACADIRSGVGVLVNGPIIHSLVNGGLIH